MSNFFQKNKKVLAIVLIIIVSIEIIGHIAKRIDAKPKIKVIVDDPILHHKLKPNLYYIDKLRYAPYSYVIFSNEQSWVEDHNISLTAPPNTYRIFYVGDSNTQGITNKGKNMPDIVEKKLKQKYKNQGINIEVINTGTSSYSTIIYYLLIKNKIIKYNPDLVVINIDMTDVPNDVTYRRLAKFDERGLPTAVLPTYKKRKYAYRLTPYGEVKVPKWRQYQIRAHVFLVNNSIIIKTIEDLTFPIIKKLIIKYFYKDNLKPQRPRISIDLSGDWLSKEWNETIEENVKYSMNILAETIKLLKEKGIKVMVTAVPHYPQYTGEWSTKPHEIVKETSLKYGARFLDSYSALKKFIKGADIQEYYWKIDPTHFNEKGNAIWAEAQINFLLDQKNNLLPQLNDPI